MGDNPNFSLIIVKEMIFNVYTMIKCIDSDNKATYGIFPKIQENSYL